MSDLSSVLRTQSSSLGVENSTNKKAGAGLELTDFLSLMVAQFQNQDIDNTASTSDMLNQMVQMTVVQAVTQITTLLNESTTLMYSASLVGKDVTIGKFENGKLTEIYGTVTGTGTLNGRQVIFVNDESYYLTDILAIGKLPPKEEEKPDVPGTPEHPIVPDGGDESDKDGDGTKPPDE